MQSEKLLEKLVEDSKQIINKVEKLKSIDLKYLKWKETENSWSILECLEHLNLYGEFYLPQIEAKIIQSNTKFEPNFKSGFLGNYFSKSMLPKEKLNKMKTFKDKNPLHSNLDKTVIDKFINQQLQLIELLSKSKNVSLNKVKIQTSILSIISLKLGDTFQFIINHIFRHLSQIDQIQNLQKQ